MRKLAAIGSMLLALVLFSCSSTTEPENDANPAGELTQSSSCKNFTGGTQDWTTPSEQDCIEYVYDGESILTLRHINAGFNCCPDSLTAQFHVSVGSIIIDEGEVLDQGGCHCLCLYDLDYRIANLPPGPYAIRVNQPYLWPGAAVLEFQVDLSAATSGSHCVERDQYPWGTP